MQLWWRRGCRLLREGTDYHPDWSKCFHLLSVSIAHIKDEVNIWKLSCNLHCLVKRPVHWANAHIPAYVQGGHCPSTLLGSTFAPMALAEEVLQTKMFIGTCLVKVSCLSTEHVRLMKTHSHIVSYLLACWKVVNKYLKCSSITQSRSTFNHTVPNMRHELTRAESQLNLMLYLQKCAQECSTLWTKMICNRSKWLHLGR